jgi:alpha-glucosidase
MRIALGWLLLVAVPPAVRAQTYTVAAPGGTLEAVVSAGAELGIDVRRDGRPVISISPIGLDVEGELDARRSPPVRRVTRRSIDTVIVPAVPVKRARIPDRFNELRLDLGSALALVVRAYDDGVAYRFETAFRDSLTIRNELATFRFAAADSAYVPVVTCRKEADCFHSSFEENYRHLPVAALPRDTLAFLPLVARTEGGYALLTESDLWDYPGLWVQGGMGEPTLTGRFAAYPLATEVFGGEFKQRLVTRRAAYIARTAGTRTFPWRVVMVAADAARLIENDLVYRLARPQLLGDASWVRPGKSTEEWITSRLLHGVDFVSGLNTPTYRYLIDFAAEYGLEYVMFDAGWSNPDDLFARNPDIDLPGLIEYARRKRVGIILWNLAMTLDRQMEAALDQYQRWGVKGIMVDFMDRDDQPMLRFYERVAREAARRRMFVNFHGAYKPTGMERAYPNLLTREAVLGHEYDMWSDRVTPDHALTIPFIRMAAGAMDFEGGSMNNGTQKGFRVVFERPMSQGTRAQQLAQYVVYESPLQYLAETASDYRADPDFTRVLADLPTTWDETRVLQGAIGDYVVLARRKAQVWYVAAMTDWTARQLDVALDFLPPGAYDATVVSDGANADRYAADYLLRRRRVDAPATLPVRLAPGGGFVAILRPR